MDDFMRTLTFDFFGQGKHKITCDEFLGDPNAVLLDVRTREEVECLSFPLKHQVSLSLAIPLDKLPDRLDEIPRDRVVGLLCVTDVRSSMAFLYLRSKGLNNVRILAGGTSGLVEQLKTGKVRNHILAKLF